MCIYNIYGRWTKNCHSLDLTVYLRKYCRIQTKMQALPKYAETVYLFVVHLLGVLYLMSHQNKCFVEYTANAHCNKLELHYMNIVLLNISVSNNLNWIQPMNWLQIGRRTGNMVKWSTLQKIISNHNLFRWLMLHLWNEKLSVIFCSQAAFQKTAETFGGIDIVCNNAGILNETEWEKTVSINLVRSCKSNKLHLVVIMPCMPNMLNS